MFLIGNQQMHNKSDKESAIKNTNLSNKDGYLTINIAV